MFIPKKNSYKILIKFQKLGKLEAKIIQKVNWNCLDIVILCWSMEIKNKNTKIQKWVTKAEIHLNKQ